MALGTGSCVCVMEKDALVSEGAQGQMAWARGQAVTVTSGVAGSVELWPLMGTLSGNHPNTVADGNLVYPQGADEE